MEKRPLLKCGCTPRKASRDARRPCTNAERTAVNASMRGAQCPSRPRPCVPPTHTLSLSTHNTHTMYPATATGVVSLAAAAATHALAARPARTEADRLATAVQLSRLSDAKSLQLPALVSVAGTAYAPDGGVAGTLADGPPCVLLATTDALHVAPPSLAPPTATRSMVRECDWGLDDNSGVRIPVTGARRAVGLPLLTTAAVAAPDPRPGRRALDALFSLRALGRVTTERGLPVGTRLTVVGVLDRVPAGAAPRLPGGITGGDGRVVALTPPPGGGTYWVTDATPAGVVAAAAAAAARTALAAHGLAVVGGALLTARAVAGVARALRRRRAARRLAKARAARDAATSAGGGEDHTATTTRDVACVVCFTAPVDAAYPCGHAVACRACAVAAKSCVVCRARGRVMRLYLP